MNNLSKSDLLNLVGGTTREEYCETLNQIIANNWDNMTPGEKDGAMIGWNKYCAGH